MDTSLEYLFDSYFDDINLNDELKSFYEFINDDELNESFFEEKNLADIRNENYQKLNLRFANVREYGNEIYCYTKIALVKRGMPKI